MVTWDESWRFTINYQPPAPKYAKAKIANITIIEPTGQVHQIKSSGGQALVASQTVRIIVTLSNIGEASGKLSAELLVGGSSKGIKTTSGDVPVGGVSTVSWDSVQLPGTSNTLTVRAGH